MSTILSNITMDIPGIGSVPLMFRCNHCGKEVAGGTYIYGVFYCPMCASIINRNNNLKGFSYPDFGVFVEKSSACDKCSNNPKNGGSGICHCILGQKVFYSR